ARSTTTPERRTFTASARRRSRRTRKPRRARARRPTTRKAVCCSNSRHRSRRASPPGWRYGCNGKQGLAMPNEPAQPLDIRQQLATLLAEQRQLAERLHGDQARFRRLARSVWSVQEEERRRLARDLHDGVGHGLTTIIHLLTNALDALAQDSGNDQVRAFVDKARDVGRSTLADTRAMSRLLRP